MRSKLLCSLAALVAIASSTACGTCGPDMAARGSASAAWSITVGGQPATCAQVGAASVSLLLHSRASGSDTVSSFACTQVLGATSPVVAGAYDATLTLHAADGATLAAMPTQASVSIGAGEVTALRPAAFAVSGRGKLVLSFATLSTRSNCLPHDQGGAGLTGEVIFFERIGGGCAAVTFTRSRGNTTIGTYTVNCSAPPVASCIERDETLSIDDLESGPYAISVSALVGTTRCALGNDVLSVPAGATLTKPIQLAPQQGPSC
ncbi:MAG TPA: hypothetical protein VGD37_43055 [Kofleriaceae bacterium]